MTKKNIFICCTEQSGENICFNILKRLDLQNINVDGICGVRSEKYFRKKYYDISDFKSIGLFEIFLSIRKFIKMLKILKNEIIKNKYDLVICIDSPDFNYNLAKLLRKSNYPNKIIQIVAPTVWAWRKKRAKKFSNYFNEIFLLFEFERNYFQFPNFMTTFIGHPIFHIKKRLKKNNYKFISFLMGSRENEVNKLFNYFDNLEKYIQKNHLEWHIFIPTLPHLINNIKIKTSNWKTKTFISSDIDNFSKYYDDVFISITCSGTASLEIAKRNIPQIVIYKLNFFTEIIIKLFVKVKNACLINIISKKSIIPEIINSNLTNKKLIKEFENLLNNEDVRINQIEEVNRYIPNIEKDESPYDISAKRILSII